MTSLITRLILCPTCLAPISASYQESDREAPAMSDICTECRVGLSKSEIKLAQPVPAAAAKPSSREFAELALRDCDDSKGPQQQENYLRLAQVHATLAVADGLESLRGEVNYGAGYLNSIFLSMLEAEVAKRVYKMEQEKKK